MTIFELFNQKPYFDTKSGKEFREKSPKLHAVAVICVMGAIIWFVSSLFGGADAPKDQARNARLYAISFGQMAIEEKLRDPSSVKYDLKAYNLSNDSLCYSYRAKNGFGGMVSGVTVIRDGQAFNSVKAFDKYCASGDNYEIY